VISSQALGLGSRYPTRCKHGGKLKQIAGHKTTAATSAYQRFARERGRVVADNLNSALESLKSLKI